MYIISKEEFWKNGSEIFIELGTVKSWQLGKSFTSMSGTSISPSLDIVLQASFSTYGTSDSSSKNSIRGSTNEISQ